MMNDLSCLHHHSVGKWEQMQIYIHVSYENLQVMVNITYVAWIGPTVVGIIF